METVAVTSVLRGVRAWAAGRPWLFDAALGGGLTAFDVVTLAARDPAPGPAALALWGVQTVPLLWRRLRPLTVLAAMTVAFIAFEAADPVPGKTPGPYFLIFGVHAAARYAPAAASLAASGGALAGAVAVDLALGRSPGPRPDSLEPITATTFAVFLGVAWLLGHARRRIDADARRLRDLNAQLGDANARLRAERERNARQAVAAERARIARDLHDVVAHHVSAIAVQARSTEDVVHDDPALGRAGVARIAETADTALIEMRRILGLLDTGRDDGGAEPSLRGLGNLVEAAERAGCRVRADVDAEAPALPRAVQVSAYRIVQEALTNVLKHAGPTDVRVALRTAGASLVVEVGNGPAVPGRTPVPGSGRGLIGLRERVAAFDGTLRAGPDPAGGWLVRAELPLEGVR
ncbi:histidine kinase [Actinomadura nitritigenes]|uniref:histidine kinase n=1 Tax=Actinomadura nitritigenes TaxID=134602 RepID=A0ABS3RDU3_9ACTN|nr:histidine kinase [Actinomadura nitritigenes]MBO2444400.1 sensor histidine kinase [Actinomadura nitritigenes]